MKLLGLAFFFFLFLSATTYAQEPPVRKSNYPYWAISKEVHQLPYKSVPAEVTVERLAWNISKGVQQQQVERLPARAEKVSMTGTPSWVISKGVARMQYERKQAE